MGRMQFIVPHRERLPEQAIALAYLAGLDESPYRSRNSWNGDWLAIDRDEGDSGSLTIPWTPLGRSPLALTTGTLVERPRPYLLPLELARGTLDRVRTYANAWQSLGLVLPVDLGSLLKQTVRRLGAAATSQDQPEKAAQIADETLLAALQAGELLCRAYAEQSAQARRRTSPNVPVLVGASLGNRDPHQPHGEPLLQATNTLIVPFSWRDIQVREGESQWQLYDEQVAWCLANERRICGGPLIDIEPDGLPAWTNRFDDFSALQSAVAGQIQAIVNRYRGKVQIWNCAGGLSRGGDVPLLEEQRLRLAVLAIESVRASDPRTPIVIAIDQPWGEYLRDEPRRFSPLQFADALARADLGLSGFTLEINLGFSPKATYLRDTLQLSRQIDRWSIFNLPLLIQFTLPPGDTPGHTAERAWMEQAVPVLLGKPAVQALVWGRTFDGQTGRFRDRGLFDSAGNPKPALAAFSAIRDWADLAVI